MNYVCHNYISKTKPCGVGWTHAEKKALERMLLQQAAAIEQLTKKNSDLVKLVQQLTVTQTNMKQEISTFKATLSSGTGLSGAVNNKQYYFDAVMPPGDKCGQQKPMIGWKVNYDQYRNNSNGNNVDNKYFNGRNGKFTAPSAGVYHCCASARCKQGGVCDWTITKNGGSNVRASFGTRVTNRNEWQSQGVCWTEGLSERETYQVNLESTGGNDCLEETGWNYGRFSCFYVSPN